MGSVSRGLSMLALCMTVFPASPQRLHAEPPHITTALRVDDHSLSDFDSCFQSISSQLHSVILVEGVPPHASLTGTALADVQKNLNSVPTTASPLVVVETIATAYQYDVESVDDHTLLLRKQYKDPDDLPCVTFPEIVHALKAIDKLTNTFSQPDHPGPELAEIRLADSITPEELPLAKHGIRLGTLPADQRELAKATAFTMWLGGKTDALHKLLRELARLDEPTSRFKWIEEHGIDSFGYEGPFGPNHILWPVPLNNGWRCQINVGMHRENILARQTDPTVPTETDRRLAPGMLANRLPSTQTLGEFARARSKKTAPLIHLLVDDAVADKPFSLFSAEYAPEAHTIRSIADLYGLALRAPSATDFTITLPEAHAIEGAADIPKEIRRVVPLPLIRFLEGHTLQNSPMLLGSGANASSTLMERQQQQQQATSAHKRDMEAFYYPAVRRLLFLTSPLVPTRQSEPVPIRSASEEAHRLIAISRLAGMPLTNIDDLLHIELPSIMNDLDACYIHVSKTKNSFALSFGPDVTGQTDESRVFGPNITGLYRVQLSVGITNPPEVDSPLLRD